MAFPAKVASGVLLSVFKKQIARTVIQKLKIALHVAGGAGLDSTNMVRERLEKKAQEKTAKRGVHSRGSTSLFFVLQALLLQVVTEV
jgi:hypothetical protein